jgi:TPR repeat protein
MTNLGAILYERGELGEAESWWRRAAEAGDPAALFHLRLLPKKQGEPNGIET